MAYQTTGVASAIPSCHQCCTAEPGAHQSPMHVVMA